MKFNCPKSKNPVGAEVEVIVCCLHEVRKSNKNVNNQFCGEKKIEWLFFGPKIDCIGYSVALLTLTGSFFSWEDTMDRLELENLAFFLLRNITGS